MCSLEDPVTQSLNIPVGFDPTDPAINEAGVPFQEYLAMRRTSPVFFVEQGPEARAGFGENDRGFWAVSTHEHVSAVSKNSKDYSTAINGAIIRFAEDMTRDQVEMQNVMLINQDGDEHSRLRRIISRGFTPRAIGTLHEMLESRAQKIVDEALAKGSGDFVADVAAELPLQAIADLLGVPQEDRSKLFTWSNQMLSYDDPDVEGDPELASIELLNYFMPLAEDRKANPREDIVTKLVTAGEDGAGLTSDEFGFFVILLTVAGNETTRNAITHGMMAFLDNPDQWELYCRERPETTYDEIIRWATPVTAFQRTATADLELGGVTIKAGERVGMLYASANNDEAVFTDPRRFDITRNPNPHLSFGGHGAHYCIGANLARLEVQVMFNTLADRMTKIAQAGPAVRFRSGWINGIKELPVTYAN